VLLSVPVITKIVCVRLDGTMDNFNGNVRSMGAKGRGMKAAAPANPSSADQRLGSVAGRIETVHVSLGAFRKC